MLDLVLVDIWFALLFPRVAPKKEVKRKKRFAKRGKGGWKRVQA